MRSNYRNHLSHELEHIKGREEAAKEIASQHEPIWKSASSLAASFVENTCEVAETAKTVAKKDFRGSQAKVSGIRTKRGEIEDELFVWAEDEETWPFHQ